MVDVLFNNDDITVLGPPPVVEVLVDIGPQGTRGNKVFVGTGEPNSLTVNGEIFSQILQLQDLYINTSPGSNYGYMYQYISAPGGNTWTNILSINPVIYSENALVTFSAGTAANIGDGSIVIPISDIVVISGGSLDADNFSVQYSIVNDSGYPIASSMVIPEIVGSDLTINISGSQYDGSSWEAMSGDYTVHVFITIIL